MSTSESRWCDFCNFLQDANQRGWLRPTSALRSQEPVPPNMAAVLATALDIAHGLAYMHSKGILHRDLTAGNVLLVDEPSDPRGFTAKARLICLHATLEG